LTALLLLVRSARAESLCVQVPGSTNTTPYWSVGWLPDGSLIAGTNRLVEFANGELRTEATPQSDAVRAFLPLNATQLLAVGVGGAVRFDRSTGLWRHDPTPVAQKPAGEILDARLSDDGASLVLATATDLQYVTGNAVSEWGIPASRQIYLTRLSGRLAVCHYPYAALGVTPQGPVERPDLAWTKGASLLMPAGSRIVGLLQGSIGVFASDGALLWRPEDIEKLNDEWFIGAGGDDHALWIATHKGGVRWYDSATGKKMAEALVGRQLSGRIFAVAQHADGRLAVATESRVYVVYPPAVSSLPLPSGRLLFFQRCGGGAVAVTSGGSVSVGSGIPPLDDTALSLAEWQGKVVVGSIGRIYVDGKPCEIGGIGSAELIPAGNHLLALQANRALLIDRDLTISAQVVLPEIPNGAAEADGAFLIGTGSGSVLSWRPSESLTTVRPAHPHHRPVRIKAAGGAVWQLSEEDARRDNQLVPLPEGIGPVDVFGDSTGTWLLCSDAAGGASLWSVPPDGAPVLLEAPGVPAIRQPQGMVVLPSGQFAIVDSSRVILVDRDSVRPQAAQLPGPTAAVTIDGAGERVLSRAEPQLRLAAAEDTLILRWSGGDPLAARQIRWRIMPDGAWRQGGSFGIEASRLPSGSGAVAVSLECGGQVKTEVFSYLRKYPWYLHSWSLLLYAALLIVLGLLAVRWRTRRLARRAQELEQLVAERTQDLARANAAKEEFLASMSHEIRNPLNGVLGICSMLDEAPLPPRERLLARTLRGCSEQLRSLLDDILDFSLIERGDIPLHPEDFLLQSAIEAAVRTVDIGAARTEINQPPEPLWFSGDHLKLRQIVINLVTNALKYGVPSRAAIICDVAARDDSPGDRMLTVSVRNTGPTIPPEEIPLLFEAFHRGSAARASRSPGAGLGLTVSRRIAAAMKGELTVLSKDGITEFTLRVPLQPAAGPRPLRDLRSSHPPLTVSRALAVEDEQYNRLVLGHTLGQLGYSVDWAADGKTAIAMAMEGHYDLIFTDWELPDIPGPEVARRILASLPDPKPPIIAVTAYATKDRIRACLDAGIVDVVTKPVTKEKMESVIKGLGSTLRAKQSLDITRSVCDVTPLQRFGETATVIAEFRSTLLQRWQRVVFALEVQEAKAAFEIHSLRGQALVVSATALAEQLELLESAAREQRWDDAGRLRFSVENELTLVADALDQFGLKRPMAR
jgi:signal transduction histidine kinase/CheY-like chemotaxis protein